MAQRIKQSSPQDVRDIQKEIKKFYDTEDEQGRKIGNALCGIYAFYDYEDEPIYVGQTVERIRGKKGQYDRQLGPAHKREERFVGIAPNPSNPGKTS